MKNKAQMNSEILKWILMIILFAVAIIIILTMLQGLPDAASNIIGTLSSIL